MLNFPPLPFRWRFIYVWSTFRWRYVCCTLSEYRALRWNLALLRSACTRYNYPGATSAGRSTDPGPRSDRLKCVWVSAGAGGRAGQVTCTPCRGDILENSHRWGAATYAGRGVLVSTSGFWRGAVRVGSIPGVADVLSKIYIFICWLWLVAYDLLKLPREGCATSIPREAMHKFWWLNLICILIGTCEGSKGESIGATDANAPPETVSAC